MSISVRATATLAVAFLFLGACDDPSDPSAEDGAFIGLSGIPANRQMFEGTSLFLVATVYDEDHVEVVDAAVEWRSSDTTVARVDPWETAVTVTGLRPGTVDIFARSQGMVARVEIRVVVVPIVEVVVGPGDIAGYVGSTHQLGAGARDSLNRWRNDLDFEWRSLDPRVATVDDSGVVSLHAAGTARIRASIGGHADTVEARVFARPVSDWSRVSGEWTTYQRNATHTGFVPATLDPLVFEQAWAAQPLGAAPLNPVVFGAGRVYVSNNSYFAGPQAVGAFDIDSGTEVWRYDFGEVHSVNPPAFADGRVFVQTGGHEDSFLWAFEAATGAGIWRTPYGNQWSRYYAPTVVSGRVYTAGGSYGGMYAFDAADGSEEWFLQLNQYDQFTPAVADGHVYAYTGSYQPQVTIADATSGSVIDTIMDPGFEWMGWSMNLAPVVGSLDNLLAAQGNRLISFGLTPGSIGWSIASNFHGQVTLADGVIYVMNGHDVEARAESSGALLWSWRAPEDLRNTMIVTENLLFVSTANYTWAIDLEAHVAVWYTLGSGYLALSSDGYLAIADGYGTLTMIDVRE